MKQIEVDRILRERNDAKRDCLDMADRLMRAESRVESIETLYRDAIEDKERWKRKFHEVLAVMEDAREMVGNRDG
jgi:hypothetical protein